MQLTNNTMLSANTPVGAGLSVSSAHRHAPILTPLLARVEKHTNTTITSNTTMISKMVATTGDSGGAHLSCLPTELLLRILADAACVSPCASESAPNTSTTKSSNHLITVRLRPVAACSRLFLGLAKAVIVRHRQRFALLAVGLSPSPGPTPEAQYEFQWAPHALADHFAARERSRQGGALAVSLDLYIHFTVPYSSPPLPGTKSKVPSTPPRRDSLADSVLSPSSSLSQLRHLTLHLPAHIPTQLESLAHLVRPLILLLDLPNPPLRSLDIRFAADAQQGIQLWALHFARTMMSRPSTITHLSLSLPVTWASTTPDPLVHSALVDLLTRSPAVTDGLTRVELEWPDLRVDIVARLAHAATQLRQLAVRPMYWLPGPDDVTVAINDPTQPNPSSTTLILSDAKSGIPPIPHPSSRFFTCCSHLVFELSHIRPPAAAHIAAVLVPGTGLLPLFPNLAAHLSSSTAITLSWLGIPSCKSPTSLSYALNGIAHHRPHPIRDLGLVNMRKDLLAYIRLASVHRLLVHTAVTESAPNPATAGCSGAGGVLDMDPLDVLVPHVMTMVPNAKHVWVVVDHPQSFMSSASRASSSTSSASGSGWASLDTFRHNHPWFHELLHDRPSLSRLVLVVRGRHGQGPPLDMLEYAGYKREWVASAPWIVGERELGRRETVRVEMGPGLPIHQGDLLEDVAGDANRWERTEPPALEYLGFGKAGAYKSGQTEDVWSLLLERNTCK